MFVEMQVKPFDNTPQIPAHDALGILKGFTGFLQRLRGRQERK